MKRYTFAVSILALATFACAPTPTAPPLGSPTVATLAPAPVPTNTPAPVPTNTVARPSPTVATRTPTLQRGTPDPDIFVDIYDPDAAWAGTTLFADNHNLARPRIIEVNMLGEIVWQYLVRENLRQFTNPGFDVEPLPNGNTLVSLRNFNLLVKVDPKGAIVRTIGEGIFRAQHDPEILPNGNLLVADHSEPQRAIEVDLKTNQIVWEFVMPRQLVRDANRLPNGNTLITGGTAIVEITPQGKAVWRLRLREELDKQDAPARGFYKAERIGIGAPTSSAPPAIRCDCSQE